MARKNNTEGLTDIGAEEEIVSAALPAELTFASQAEAEAGVRQAIQLLERFHNWAQTQEQFSLIAIETSYRRKAQVKDGRAVTNGQGAPVFDDPYVNVQLKLPLSPGAISLPLHQGIVVPSTNA